MPAGSRVIVQMHYNLLAGEGTDRSAARLRVTDARPGITPLETMLLVAPVELACRPDHAEDPLCDRDAALADVVDRFGAESDFTVNGLQFICNGTVDRGSPVQECDREITEPTTVVAAAGHMHLLGESIRIEANPGRPGATTVLDIPQWDFDNQGAKPLAEPLAARRRRHPARHLPPRPGQPRPAARLRREAGPLRAVGRGHHRRDVPRHRDGHPALTTWAGTAAPPSEASSRYSDSS